MNQRALAEAVGVAQQTVSRWLAGSRLPEMTSSARLAKLFGAPLEDVVAAVEASSPAEPEPVDDFDKRLARIERVLRERGDL